MLNNQQKRTGFFDNQHKLNNPVYFVVNNVPANDLIPPGARCQNSCMNNVVHIRHLCIYEPCICLVNQTVYHATDWIINVGPLDNLPVYIMLNYASCIYIKYFTNHHKPLFQGKIINDPMDFQK